MFKIKTSWLAFIGAMSFAAAGCADEAGTLIDRAHYWHKQGQSDLELRAWQQLLMLEPNHAEARAAIAQNPPPLVASNPSPPQVDFIPRGESPNGLESDVTQNEPSGALSASENPDDQERLKQAKYWESRGRSDLAARWLAQTHDTAKQVPADNAVRHTPILSPAAKGIGSVEESGSSLPHIDAPATQILAAAPENPTPQATQDEMAQYWQKRGRSDLTGQFRTTIPVEGMRPDANPPRTAMSATPVFHGPPRKPINLSIEPDVVDNPLTPPATLQELSARAAYWESRGRGDLSGELRQALQKEESGYVASRATAQVGTQHARTPQKDRAIFEDKLSLEEALLKHPDSLQASLDLAAIYRDTEELSKARALITGVLAHHPDLPEALLASAQLYAAQHLWLEVLHELENISPVARTTEMARLQKMAWAHVQIDRAEAMVKQGKSTEAELLLRRVAVELSVNADQAPPPEPPPLWKRVNPPR
ncbi:MAG: hypothetical protein AUJ88_02105 [Gallionellaceae bacterium CG1_02_56_997]|nr:MAG: hypothetical protein AUJ88_02105 [Gallionellaceae bacterium CG1_02_56_997]HCJ51629.1 hypothetical protein [Gallionella sp.]